MRQTRYFCPRCGKLMMNSLTPGKTGIFAKTWKKPCKECLK